MKKQLWVIVAFCLVLLASGCSTDRKTLPCFDNMNDVKTYVRNQMEHGMTKIVMTTRDLQTEDFKKINEYFDGYYGTVRQCEMKENVFSSKKTITFTCDITDEYYVEDYIINGKSIPEERPEAKELAAKCLEIRNAMMEDLGDQTSDYDKELWIHDYLVLETAYGFGNGQEDEVHESYGALISNEAVCNGYAYAMKLLCDINFIECQIIVGDGDGEPHAWNLVKIDGQWYHLDVTWDDPTPDTEGRIIYTYFNINDERASLSHTWIPEHYPKADAMKDNYYIRNNLYCEDYDDFKSRCIDILEQGNREQFQLMVGDYDPGIYSDDNMKFIFEHTPYRSFAFQNLGEIPYMTIYVHLS